LGVWFRVQGVGFLSRPFHLGLRVQGLGVRNEGPESRRTFVSSLLLAILELNDTNVYVPSIRALLGTASQFCEVVVLKSQASACLNQPDLTLFRGFEFDKT
jgi:hypothetical protein